MYNKNLFKYNIGVVDEADMYTRINVVYHNFDGKISVADSAAIFNRFWKVAARYDFVVSDVSVR